MAQCTALQNSLSHIFHRLARPRQDPYLVYTVPVSIPTASPTMDNQTRHIPLMVQVVLGSPVEVAMDTRRMEMVRLGRVRTVRIRPITDYHSLLSILHPLNLSSSSSLPLLPFLVVSWTLFSIYYS